MITLLENPPALPRSTPEQQGISSAAILKLIEALESQVHELHSLMLVRHGHVVAEAWWQPFAPEYPHQVFSLSKSFTSTAIGLAIGEGFFSLEDPILSFFPDDAAKALGAGFAAVQVRHLLTMATGQAIDTWTAMVTRPDGDWIKGFFEVPVTVEPGSQFVYNTGATYMLSAILQRATGLNLLNFLQPRLFDPLGIEGARWAESPQGITAGGIGLCIKTEDIARFGQLYLQDGLWNGQQIIPAAWVQAASSRQISNEGHLNPDWSQGYGYQFWMCRHQAFRGDGVFGQYCIVLPEQDAVLAITSGIDIFDMQLPLDLIWEILLPAMGAAALPDDANAQATLRSRLKTLSLPAPQGRPVSSIADQVSGRTYVCDPNELQVETITPVFADDECTFVMKTPDGEETIPIGLGNWKRGISGLFRQAVLFDRTPIASIGAWVAEDIFAAVVCLYETPHYHRLTCHFAGDDVMIEVGINVSLESLKPHLLTACFRA
jgi:CubicO group peptidase (beta-lactamase class C family)